MRRAFINVIRIAAIASVCGLARTGTAHAGTIGFGGEPQDNLWQLSVVYCTNGVAVRYNQTQVSNESTLAFSLQVSQSTPSLRATLPTPIVSAPNTNESPLHGIAVFRYAKHQKPGTPTSFTVQRWDHGIFSADEASEEVGDGSPDVDDDSFTDDVLTDTGTVQHCRIRFHEREHQKLYGATVR